MRRVLLILPWICILVVPLIAQKQPIISAAGLPPGVYKYRVNFMAGETPTDLNMVIEIRETVGGWTVAEKTEALLGEISDTAIYDKKSLMLLTRVFRRGPVSTDLVFKENRIKGKMVISGRENPFDVEMGGPLFGDGPGFIFAMGVLPLAEGYSASFRSFDIESQKAELTRLKVSGLENVTVPAGSFESYRVEISTVDIDAENYTVWIARNSHKPVKIVTPLPEMGGGAKMTAVLQ
jgi:hypothetical protein